MKGEHFDVGKMKNSVAGFRLISETAAKVLFIDPRRSRLPEFCVNLPVHCAGFHYKQT